LAVLGLVGAACAGDEGGGGETDGGEAVDCATVEFGCVEIGPGEPIRIGSLQAISPPDVADLGTDALNGVTLAIDNLDGAYDGTPGQLLGHDIDVQSESDQCSKEGGQAGAQKLAADPTIVFVIGTTCSSSALGVADRILSDSGVVIISPSNTATTLTQEGIRQPFYFRTAANDAIQAKVTVDFWVQELGVTQVATIHDESPYTEGLTAAAKIFLEEAGGTVTAEEAIKSTDKNFGPLLTSIAQTEPELVYFPDFNPACALIANQAGDIPELDGVILMGAEGCLSANWFEVGNVDDVYMSGPIPTGNPPEAYQAFLDAYTDQFGNPKASYNSYAFDAFNIMMQAMEAVAIENEDGSLTIPRLALRDAMYDVQGLSGLTGTLTCIETGDCQSQTAVAIGVYQTPAIPVEGGDPNAEPLFREEFTLEEALSA
jgi:branched-chain amino acid transport system substrate-binding protein